MQVIRQIWNRLTLNQRLLIGSIGGAFVFALALSLGWARKPDFTVLYANVSPEDAGEIVDQLRSQKVSYHLEDGGRTILVPSKDVYESRLNLAVQGLPETSSVGYEIFDKSSFGVTDFVQRLNYRRALEGEIARTIQSVNEVRTARVHIVIPEETLFAEDAKEATASVVLRLKGSLHSNQVAGIVRLVASAVEGLTPENVTVVDTYGNLLSRPHEAGDVAAASGSQLELKAEVEKYLRNKVTGMLEGVLGRGKAVAQVDADLDFEQVERTIETYDPETAAVRSEQRTKGNEGDDSKSEDVLTNYELSRTLEHIVSPVGGIQKLTVAVLIDGTYETGQGGERTYVPRDTEEMTRLTGIIQTAVGFDDTRGDRLEVHNIPFENDGLFQEQQAVTQSERMHLMMDVLNRVGQVLVILLIAVLIRVFYRRASNAMQVHSRSVAEQRRRQEAVLSVPSEDDRYVRMQQQIVSIAQQRPEEMTQLIRTWMKED